jgi:hypothetical protein
VRRAWIAAATVLTAGIAAAPAPALPDSRNAKPRILSVELEQEGREVRVTVVGRDPDDVVRGAEISWGEDQPAQGLSACAIGGRGERGRRGSKERFEHSYAYPAAGRYTITVRVFSGGCGKRPMQRSRRRTLTVDVG